MNTAPATLTIGDRTFTIGDHVSTHLGNGYIVGLDPLDHLEIGVKLHTPRAEGSLFWFSFGNVLPVPQQEAA